MGLVKPPILLLFDIDGTLLRTRGAGREATRLAMLEVFGLAGGIADHHFSGKTDWFTLIELLTPEGVAPQQIADRIATYDDAVGRHTASIVDEYDVSACPFAPETIAALRPRRDVLLGLVTGNARRSAPHKLRAAGFDPAWFPVGAFGTEAIDRNALTPLALERAQAHLGAAPSQVVVIGDTPMDVACARVIGAIAVTVETGFASRDALLASQPDHHLTDLRGFLPLLDSLM
jgi:phosphoglycolate phosphatase-like HAD superfamily hydrolase